MTICAFEGCNQEVCAGRQFWSSPCFRIYLCRKHLIETWNTQDESKFKAELEKARIKEAEQYKENKVTA